MALPPIDEKTRAFGASGYKGKNAKELARLARAKRDVVMTDEAFLEVCVRLVQGEPLVLICADTTMPSQPQVMKHLFDNETARELYYAAREMQMETLAEEMMTIANDDSDDHSWVGGRRFSHNEVVQRARVQIDTRRFVMQSMSPKRFGNKNITEIQGNPNQPVVLQVVTGVPRNDTSLIRGEIVAPKIIEGTVVKSIKDAE
jgi:hypothetical protein